MAKINVKVKEGIILRNPLTQTPISENGTRVTENTFWRRRLKAGDVSIVEEKLKPMKISAKISEHEKPKPGDNK